MIATDKQIKDMLLQGASYREIKNSLSAGDARVYRLKKQLEKETGIDVDLLIDTVRTNKQLQKQRDLNRVTNKKLREGSRLENAVVAVGKEITDILTKYQLPKTYKCKQYKIKGNAAIVQLSDLHFNELIDLVFNKYDFNIATKRLQLYAQKLKVYLKASRVTNVLLANTGDLINSDRRMDEILSNATNRSKAVILAVILLEQFVLDLMKDFKITVASVIGNESRMTQDNGWTDLIASDNYDFTIHQLLSKLFEKTNVIFLPMQDSLERIVEIAGKKLLMIHGHQIKHVSLERTIQNIIGKYSAQGIKIDFVILGDKHCLEPDIEVPVKNKGFIKLEDIKINDIVYGYEKGVIVESKVLDTIKGVHTGRWYEFNSAYIKQTMTDEHCLYTKNDEYYKIKDFLIEKNLDELVCGAFPLKDKQIYNINNISDDLLRFLVATCADASFERVDSKSPTIRFHFVKERKIKRLTNILKNLNIEIKFIKNKKGYRNKRLDKDFCKKVIDLIPNKTLPNWFLLLNSYQRQIIIEELRYWDGTSVTKSNAKIQCFQFCSNKSNEINLIQELLLMNGYLSRRLPNRHTVITYNTRKHWTSGVRRYKTEPKITFVKNKPVACLSTETNNFFIRTKQGTIELTGNSARCGDYYARSASMCGSNAYSDHALQLSGRASQNIHIIYPDGNLDSIKIDLQNIPDQIEGYDFNSKLEEYHAKSVQKAKKELNIDKVLI